MKKKLLTVLIVVFAFGVAWPVISPGSAQGFLTRGEAENKATTNTWNVFCHGSWYVCSTYPGAYGAYRYSDRHFSILVGVKKTNGLWCSSWREVYERWDGSKYVEGGLYNCQ